LPVGRPPKKESTRLRNQRFLGQYLSNHPCVECGQDDIRLLDFDHLRNKANNVVRLVHTGYSIQSIKQEIAKCEVRCKNCHTKITLARLNDWRTQYVATGKVPQIISKVAPWQRAAKVRNREFVAEHFATNHCVDCGESDIRVLEFDHEGDKTRGVAVMLQGTWSTNSIAQEIAKCSVRCRNCHAIMTMSRAGGSDWRNNYLTSLSTGEVL